ncbi:hypothetical protein IAI60_21125 [Roseomonas sp. 1311]|uniref:Phosphoribosylglycinamide formyltransferase n=3 Tax=Roseomonas marmotae TaxID=2768161 RepID=A0ABS3KI10_9PROT|nr:hypothetical protein [Roseomonas marmotae]
MLKMIGRTRRLHESGLGTRVSQIRLFLFLAVLLPLGGCGVVALPFRVTGDVVKAVPIVGDPVGAPIHAVGDVVDP